jgi:uncharacterized delta-60 repeat protein
MREEFAPVSNRITQRLSGRVIGVILSCLITGGPVLGMIQGSPLDLTFDPGKGAEDGIVETLLPQPDGKVLICGSFTRFNGMPRGYMARLNADGSLDEGFQAHPSYWVRHMALQRDGKIVVGGFFTSMGGESRNLIARLNSDGSLDKSFNPGDGAKGTLSVSITGNGDPFVFQVAVQNDGKILMTGNFTTFNRSSANGIARLNADGTLDRTFQIGSGFDRWGRSLLIQTNGQIMVAGWFNSYNGRSFNRLVRINPDGTPDTTLNAFFGDQTSCYAGVPVGGGKYVVIGHSLSPVGLFNERIRRLNPDGSVDATFKSSADEKVESIVVLPDGKLLVGGYFGIVNGKERHGIARLNPDGSLDETLNATMDNYVWTVAPDGSGKILLCGGFWHVDGTPRSGVARLFPSSTNSIAPPITPPLTLSARWADAKLTVSLPTVAGKSYTLEYKASLSDTNWIRVSDFSGDGTTKTVTDSQSQGRQRFYRVSAK